MNGDGGALLVAEPRRWHPILRETLRVALGDADRWVKLRQAHELHEIRNAAPRATQLLPMISHVLEEAQLDHVDQDVFRRASTTVGFRNELLANHAIEVLDSLAAAGITAQVLKGLAIGSMAYPDLACRPMADVDVLVPAPQLTEAIDVLTGNGIHSPVQPLTPFVRRTRHSLGTVGPAGIGIDVHWALHRAVEPIGVALTPLPTTHVQILGRSVETPTPAVHVLHAAIRGLWEPDVRWLLDAALLIEHCNVDWVELRAVAIERQVHPLVHDAMVMLQDLTGANVPTDIMADLRLAAVSADRLRRLRRVTKIGPLPGAEPKAVQELWDLWVKRTVSEPRSSRVARLPLFVLQRASGFRLRRQRELANGLVDDGRRT